MKPAVFRPARASRCCCISGRRTSAWIPERKILPDVAVYLSSRLTSFSATGCAGAPARLAAAEPIAGVSGMACLQNSLFRLRPYLGAPDGRGPVQATWPLCAALGQLLRLLGAVSLRLG